MSLCGHFRRACNGLQEALLSEMLRCDDQSEGAALDMEGKSYVLRACAVRIGIGHVCLAISNDCRMFLFGAIFPVSQAAMSRVSGKSEGPCFSRERVPGLIMSMLSEQHCQGLNFACLK